MKSSKKMGSRTMIEGVCRFCGVTINHLTFDRSIQRWYLSIQVDGKPFRYNGFTCFEMVETLLYDHCPKQVNLQPKPVRDDSWDRNPDRMGGRFTDEEINRSGWC